ncbi:MAG: pentapeptide repeat-containing protein [Deltaproteobacteria bacterium]|nr:pentapeptide repeat-containing protein [Deltaproteobacteria bacterium]
MRGKRIELQGLDLHGAWADGTLARVRLTECDLSETRFQLCSFKEAQLTRCNFDGALLNICDFDRAQVEDCSFVKAELAMTHWRATRYDGNDWSQALLDRSHLESSTIVRGVFVGASLRSTTLSNAVFEDCDFRDALLNEDPEYRNLGGAQGATFTRCDLRGADLTNLRLDRTTFHDCRFAGIKGRPAILGPVTIVNADLSEAGDGSQLVDGAELLHRWTAGAR